jgi:nucleoside phosphorylase
MDDVVIFAALAWERRAVTAALARLEPAGRARVWRGRLGDGAGCLVVQTGVGPERARRAAVEAPAARCFVACGCAGALAPWLGAGDLVAADAVVPLDGSGRPADPLPAAGAPLVAWAAGRGVRVHLGPIVSSPRVLDSGAAKRAAGGDGALVVEMESAGVAAVARARGIPFVGLRVVLDVAGQPLPFAADVVDEATGEMRPGRLLASVARPWLWPAAGRLARQTRRADRMLRQFLAALLGAGGVEALTGGAPSRAEAARG